MLREDDFNYVYKSDDDKSYKVFIDYIWYDDKYFYPDIGELKIFNYFKNVS
jgi:hypothetical protein